jgi:hypothetical protein
MVGNQVEFALPQNIDQHEAGNFMYQAAQVNVQGFISTYTFQGNGAYGPDFVLANNTISAAAGTGSGFTSGAGGEQSMYQGYDTSTGNHAGASSNNYTFGLSIDGYSELTSSGTLGSSSVQIYQQNQAPYIPAANAYIEGWNTNKIDISGTLRLSYYPYGSAPVCFQTVGGTCDTYQATVTYTGTYFRVDLKDITSSSGTFTQLWPVDIPAEVGSTVAWLNLSVGTGSCSGSSCGTSPLNVDSWSYSTLSAPSAPTYSIAGGSYGSTQSLTLTDSAPVICYSTTVKPATDGKAGCIVGTLYTGAISISGSETIFAVAGGTNYRDSAVTSNFYNISSTPDIPVPSVGGAPYYQGAQQVFLTSQVGTSIYYNTSGSPTCSSTHYTGPITVSTNETLYYVSCAGSTPSVVGATTYVISPYAGGGTPPSSVAFSVAPGSYSSAQSVALSSSSGAYICYTTATSSPTIKPWPASVSNASGTPICQNGSTLYTSPISVTSTTTIYAVAALDTTLATSNGGSCSSCTNYGPPSSPSQATYTIGTPQASTPTFSPTAGTYTGTQSVTLTAATGGVICWNTTGSPVTNGGTGCTTGTLYTGAISVSSNETIYAVAGGTGYTDSSIGSAVYVINTQAATPTFSPVAGTYGTTTNVTISTTSGSIICWNITGAPATNGASGCTTGTLYSGPVAVSTSETLYAVAGGTGYTQSSVGNAAYIITNIHQLTFIQGKSFSLGKTF